MLPMPAGVAFDEVTIERHIQQDETPLASSLGRVSDHVGLSVSNLDAWVAKLRREGVGGKLLLRHPSHTTGPHPCKQPRKSFGIDL
jgi:hypothetical protein